eukprot:5944409-Alexandrium_andersonii.AAC.1
MSPAEMPRRATSLKTGARHRSKDALLCKGAFALSSSRHRAGAGSRAKLLFGQPLRRRGAPEGNAPSFPAGVLSLSSTCCLEKTPLRRGAALAAGCVRFPPGDGGEAAGKGCTPWG